MKNVLEPSNDGGMLFECLGCDMLHIVYVSRHGNRPIWSFNGDMERPTFLPSVLIRYEQGKSKKEIVCHSFINDGRIQYLADCTHHLAGRTIDLPVFDAH